MNFATSSITDVIQTLPATAHPTEPAVGSTMLCILLVEADADLRRSLSATLRDANFQVIEAANVADALKLHQQGVSINLLIIDQDLGASATGYDLASIIREQRPVVPLILLSRPPHSGQVLTLESNDRLLTLPFGADKLLHILQGLFENAAISRRSMSDDSPASVDGMSSSDRPDNFGENRQQFARLPNSG